MPRSKGRGLPRPFVILVFRRASLGAPAAPASPAPGPTPSQPMRRADYPASGIPTSAIRPDEPE